jgi:hypothetical protein
VKTIATRKKKYIGKVVVSVLLFLFIITIAYIAGAIVTTSDSQNTSEWRGYGRSTDNNRYYPGYVVSNISTLATTNYTMPGTVYTGPVVADGFLYFVTGSTKVYQMNYSNFTQQIANFTTAGSTSYTPAVANGYLYVTGGSTLYQLNASNITMTLSNFTAASTLFSPIVVDDSVYVMTSSIVYKLNSSNVSNSLSNYTDANTLQKAIAYFNGSIYVSALGTNYATRQLNATNVTQVIATHNSGGWYPESAPTVAGGYVYPCTTRIIFKLNATNVTQRVNSFTFSGSSIDCYVNPVVANGYVYFASTGGTNAIWQLYDSNISQVVGSYTIGTTTDYNWIVATNTSVFASGSNGYLYQFDANNVSILKGIQNMGGALYGPTIVDGRILFSKQASTLYQLYSSVPITTLTSPSSNYAAIGPVANITFACSGDYSQPLSNISLYLTTASNQSFSLNRTSTVTGQTNNTNWTIALANGNYTWNCFTLASDGASSFSSNRSLYVDSNPPTVTQNFPSDGYSNSTSDPSIVNFNCSATDDIALSNISLYLTNKTNSSFALNKTRTVSGVSNVSNWTIALANGNYTWNCLALDSAGNTAWGSNRSLTINYSDSIYSQFSSFVNNPSNGTTYVSNANYSFNVTIINTNRTAGIDFNGVNYSLSNSSSSFNRTLSNLGTGNYSYYFWAYGNGTYNNYNTTSVFFYTVTQASGSVNATINYSTSNFTAAFGSGNANITLNATNLSGPGTGRIYLNGSVINSGTYPLSNVTTLQIGYYNITFVLDSTQNYTSDTKVLWVNISSPPDTTYPIFSNNIDNNATLTNSGTALFNSTVANTNGTVWLSINNANYSALNSTSNVYSVSLYLGSSGTYSYNWYAYGNGTSTLINRSGTYYYTINYSGSSGSPPEENQTTTSSSFFYEQQSSSQDLSMQALIPPGKAAIVTILREKNTGIKEIELKAKDWITGKISITSYDEKPSFCLMNLSENEKIYKVLYFNNTFDDSNIDSVRIRVGISKDWIYSNELSGIKVVKCYPDYKEISSSYKNETLKEGIYDFYTSGFSAYALLGTNTPVEFNSPENTHSSSGISISIPIILWIILIVLVGMVVLLLVKHRFYLKERFHTRFMDIEFKLRLGR